tara:strand:- start:1139 stop:1309 length:171 start_codon:yes stop_codon:yes gene_type:complete
MGFLYNFGAAFAIIPKWILGSGWILGNLTLYDGPFSIGCIGCDGFNLRWVGFYFFL